jgi:hypothetical protein
LTGNSESEEYVVIDENTNYKTFKDYSEDGN